MNPDTIVEGSSGAIANAVEALSLGGPVVAILLLLSVVGLGVVLAKLAQFRALRLGDTAPVERALTAYRQGELRQALHLLDGQRNPIAQTVAEAIRAERQSSADRGLLREETARRAGAHIENLRSHLRILEVIATLSPLLGLFGTVLGMINAFREMEAAGSQVDPAVLSGGIWEALLTTAVGLAVAIPATAASNWLDRRVERATHAMEDAVTRVYTAEAAIRWDREDDAAEPALRPQTAQ